MQRRSFLCAGAGGYASTRLFETDGVYLPPADQTPEAVLAHWEGISDTSNQAQLEAGAGQTEKFLKKAFEALKGATS